MSAYIVSESGVVSEFPSANWISWEKTNSCYAVLYDGKPSEGGRFICRVPNGHLVSFDRPGVIRQAPDARQTSLSDSLEIVTACIRNIQLSWTNKQRLKALKASLNEFDARSGQWK